MKKILIVGGTGFIGKALISKLTQSEYQINILSRNKVSSSSNNKVAFFQWNIHQKYIDKNAFTEVEKIIFLSGANIAEKRWSKRRKEELRSSRIDGLNLLFETLVSTGIEIKQFISTSAIGYYGFNKEREPFAETAISGEDYLSSLCKDWEASANQFVSLGSTVTILRLGIVLGKHGGIIKKMTPIARIGCLSPLGKGNQPMPWIHIDDVCRMFKFAIENELNGVFNAVAPQYVTNKIFTEKLASAYNKKIWLPNVPSWFLRLLLGELSLMLLNGVNVSPTKILSTGFNFNFQELTKGIRACM